MSDTAAAPAAPAAAPSNGAPPPSSGNEVPDRIHAGESFEDFQAQVRARAKALQQQQQGRLDQPPPKEKAVYPDQVPVADPAAPQEQPPPAEEQKAAEQQQPEGQQWTQEDVDLLAKVKQWMAGGEMPAEFAKAPVGLKNGDEIEYETFDEVRNGRMRQKDHTRAMQAMDRERETWTREKAAYQQHFDAIFSDERDGAAGGEAMYEIYTRQGKRKQLLALGAKLAAEEQEDIDASNGMGYAVMSRLRSQGEKNISPNDHRVQEAVKREWERRQKEREGSARQRALEFENERLKQAQEQRQQQTKNEEHWATQKKRLEQLRPRAFEALGLNHENPKHKDAFESYLGAIIRQERANEVTPEIVMKAARAAKEELADQMRAGGENKPQPKGFQPQIAGGSGKAPAASGQRAMDADSIAEKFGFPRW